jgi:hypothetical protein
MGLANAGANTATTSSQQPPGYRCTSGITVERPVDRILEVRGAVSRRFYWSGWEGWPDWDNTWEPERHFKDGGEDLVNDFWKLNTHLDRSVDILVEEEHRCVWRNAGRQGPGPQDPPKG